MMKILKNMVISILLRLGYTVIRLSPHQKKDRFADIPDSQCYLPFYSPFPLFNPALQDVEFKEISSKILPETLLGVNSLYMLWTLAKQACHCSGSFIECGVYKGGTSLLLASVLSRSCKIKDLHLFDTFEGLPDVLDIDMHEKGDFSDTSIERVKNFIGFQNFVHIHVGLIPETFPDIKDIKIAFAHIDVDLYQSVIDCCVFIYPRLNVGGIIVFDDYGFQSCPGARKAVDDYFRDKPECPLILPTGQAIVFKLPTGP
ncbi:MAG: class I SAM-dependent methyltransferase [Magnetococcales bacterium]|nr:class I SAM-dependent methyltransferase [Magnetococcales bacterium]